MTVPLIYFNTTSLDGYIADAEGRFDWGEPDHEVHSFVNDLVGPARLHLYGRRNYEIMNAWEDMALDDLPPAERDFAVSWQRIDKVVYSTTITTVTQSRTELRSAFDADEVRRWKDERDTPVLIGGGTLASVAARAGVLDEVHAIVAPTIVGDGTRFLGGGARLDLELVDEKRFANGFVYLAYRVRTAG